MDLNVMGYQTACEDSPKALRRLSLKETLEQQKNELEARLARVNAALDGLNAHPEVLQVLELVSKV